MRRLNNALHVTDMTAMLSIKDGALIVRREGERPVSFYPNMLEQVVIYGWVGVTNDVWRWCIEHGIQMTLCGPTGGFQAHVVGPMHGNVLLRQAQYRMADDPEQALALAKRFVFAKIHNARIVVQHIARERDGDVARRLKTVCGELYQSRELVMDAHDLDELRGIEGDAARRYFQAFPLMLRDGISFNGRVKRPPTDPVNATLSYCYSILTKDCHYGCEVVGLDPQMGFLHSVRTGRDSLACDLVEELRAPIVDRFVLGLFNQKRLGDDDFDVTSTSCMLSNHGRDVVIRAWMERTWKTIKHPFLDDDIEFGLIPYTQAMLLARFIRGELSDYPAMMWR